MHIFFSSKNNLSKCVVTFYCYLTTQVCSSLNIIRKWDESSKLLWARGLQGSYIFATLVIVYYIERNIVKEIKINDFKDIEHEGQFLRPFEMQLCQVRVQLESQQRYIY